MSTKDREKLHQQLYSDSVEIMDKFQDLFFATKESFKDRKVSSKEIVSSIMVLGCVQPAYKDSEFPVLRQVLPRLRDIEDTEDVMWGINSYCSYFNFHMLERIIDKLGTGKDKANLAKYKEEFSKYAKRHVFMCPSEIGAMSEGRTNMFVTLDETYDNCTLSHLRLFNINLQKILNISDVELQLCNVHPGSVKLTFQIPQYVQQVAFPLTREQEEAIAELGVLQLTCGDYIFRKKATQVNICHAVTTEIYTYCACPCIVKQ